MQNIIPSDPLSLGRPSSGRRLSLPVPERIRSEHMHVVGATGSGKSRFLLSLIQQDILEGRGVCLIDPHGELYDHIVAWLSNREGLFEDRTIRLINPSDTDWSFGFNPLNVADPLSLPTVVDSAATGLSHVMGGENIRETPLLNETIRAICYALASANLTLAESPFLYSCVHARERQHILDQIKNPVAKTDWLSYQQYRPSEYDEFFRPAARRIRPFIQNDLMRRIFGQTKNTIDFKSSMDNREILLFNLSRVGGRLTAEDQQVLGRLIINNLVARAYERDPHSASPFYLYIDEVQNFLSGDVPEILSQMRKYGLHLIMAHQYLQQLREAGDLVFHGVMGTANNKVVFKLGNPEDAAIMAERIFAGKFNYTIPKDYKPNVVGHRIKRLRSDSKQGSETLTESLTETSVVSRSHATGFSEGFSKGENSGEGANLSLIMEDENLTGDVLTAIDGSSSFSAENWSQSSGSSYANGNSQSHGKNSSQSTASTSGSGVTFAETLEPIIKREPGSYVSLEEQKQTFQDLIIKLPNRSAFAVISNQKDSVAFTTQTVDDEYFSPTFLNQLLLKQYDASATHSVATTVDEEIQQRQLSLLPKNIEELSEEDFRQ